MTELEIHFINVSQGDSTLIINRDISKLKSAIQTAISLNSSLGQLPTDEIDYLPFAIKHNISLNGTVRKAMLIDAGDDVYGGDVANYVEQHGAGKNADFYTVATHYHADHTGGFFAVFFKNFDIKNTIASHSVNMVPTIAYDCGDLGKWDNTGTRTFYKSLVDDLARRGNTKVKSFEINRTYNLGADKDGIAIKFTVVASNGTVSRNGSTSVKQVVDATKGRVDQNARSIAIILQYGDFRCFLGGDIGGTGLESGGNFNLNRDQRKATVYSTHPDIETRTRRAIRRMITKDVSRPNSERGHVCVHCANHHGSASSNDVFFVETMTPKVVICSSGIRKSFHHHPTQEFFQRIDSSVGYSPLWQENGNKTSSNPTITNTVDAYYVTEMAANGKYGNGKAAKQYTRTLPKGKILGDIILRPLSNANSGPATINMQVYGTGMLTDSKWSAIPLRTKTSGTSTLYPIGPFIHNCDKH